MNQDGNKHETQGKTKMHGGLIKKTKKEKSEKQLEPRQSEMVRAAARNES